MKSRKRKENLRKIINDIMAKHDIDDKYPNYIHYIVDDYWYWVARTAWEILHPNLDYEAYYCIKHLTINKY